MHPLHPCASLPTTTWSVTVWYCHHHQAYFASHTTYSQTGEDAITSHAYVTIEFGPFDDVREVDDWVKSYTGALALLPTALDVSTP